MEAVPPSTSEADHGVTYWEAFWVWCRVAALSFGGPAGQIAVMHRILVDEKRWVSENRFLHALNYCMLLPGPEAQQLSIYIGWLLHRAIGGLTAGLLFVLPGFLSILALSIVYTTYQDTDFVQGLFYGLKPAVVAVVVQAVARIGRRALKNRVMIALAALAFVGIFFFQLPFPLIVAGAAAIGFVGGKLWPETFVVIKGHGADTSDGVKQYAITDRQAGAVRPTLGRTAAVLVIWLTIWLAPVAALYRFAGAANVYTREAIFFSHTAMVTFGGAYSVLTYVAQRAVEDYGWLEPGEMLDGLGMAETTPGPLIQVVQFVGYLGAYRNPGGLPPIVAGVAGAMVTVWVTYAPCFLWIFLGAPYIEALRGRKSLNAALSAVTAAVVGVILNLSIWFALHTLFGTVREHTAYGMRVLNPDWSTLDPYSAAISIAALFAMFRFKIGMVPTLGAAAAIGLAVHLMRANGL